MLRASVLLAFLVSHLGFAQIELFLPSQTRECSARVEEGLFSPEVVIGSEPFLRLSELAALRRLSRVLPDASPDSREIEFNPRVFAAFQIKGELEIRAGKVSNVQWTDLSQKGQLKLRESSALLKRLISRIADQIQSRHSDAREFFEKEAVFVDLFLARYVLSGHQRTNGIGWHSDGLKYQAILPIQIDPRQTGGRVRVRKIRTRRPIVADITPRVNRLISFEGIRQVHKVTPIFLPPETLNEPRVLREVMGLGFYVEPHPDAKYYYF